MVVVVLSFGVSLTFPTKPATADPPANVKLSLGTTSLTLQGTYFAPRLFTKVRVVPLAMPPLGSLTPTKSGSHNSHFQPLSKQVVQMWTGVAFASPLHLHGFGIKPGWPVRRS